MDSKDEDEEDDILKILADELDDHVFYDKCFFDDLDNIDSPVDDLLQNNSSNSGDSFSWYKASDAENFKRLTSGSGDINLYNAAHSPPTHTPFQNQITAVPFEMTTPSSFKSTRIHGRRRNSIGQSESTNKFPKPPYSYCALIALALRNSATGKLHVSEIYKFLSTNFPYFKTAVPGWKNSIRHNLSLSRSFYKIEAPDSKKTGRKCSLWAINEEKAYSIYRSIRKMRETHCQAILDSLADPDALELIENGLKGIHDVKSSPGQKYRSNASYHDCTSCTSSNIPKNDAGCYGNVDFSSIPKGVSSTVVCTPPNYYGSDYPQQVYSPTAHSPKCLYRSSPFGHEHSPSAAFYSPVKVEPVTALQATRSPLAKNNMTSSASMTPSPEISSLQSRSPLVDCHSSPVHTSSSLHSSSNRQFPLQPASSFNNANNKARPACQRRLGPFNK
ncbi:Forkhead box protein N4 [Trichinella pseudospiralis]|uniref:Forkhead box protein N4 n=2 Tax=Trichinella pseudospiralis TaxID=6337 RepID=A0A0V1J0T5_TRIPS|nr:Forkhead box protein N4 [Trichinella pseudospiralis]KRY75727.1 Forkhead box protein N4 [Trichinella pseudospiralis]KRZ28551.1 Forkhead box protein N4 [Trichinella pseudospiralis]